MVPAFRTSTFLGILLLGISSLLVSCAGTARQAAPPAPATAPPVRFAVLSDPHVYDTSLGTAGKAFEDYVLTDAKMIVQSDEILTTGLAMVEAERPDFLIIPGDLTKDGERASHELMARRLAALRQAGIRTYVVPGNHDVRNPHAFGYSEEGVHRVANVTAEEFAEIYSECGYGDALYRDPDSLSYVAEPVPGLWLLALDSCRYREYPETGSPITGGAFTANEMRWITLMLSTAYWQSKAVIVMMHHGVVEHFPGQAFYLSAYLVRDRQKVARLFAKYGARVVFTGHCHSQDVSGQIEGQDGELFDVETASLCSYPNPVRFVQIGADQGMSIRTTRIVSLPSLAADGVDFAGFSESFLLEDSRRLLQRYMARAGVRPDDAAVLSEPLADAYFVNRAGDPPSSTRFAWSRKGLHCMGRLLSPVLEDMISGLVWTGGPADNDLTISLSTGAWSAP
jgi:3',5'-cyclic AMP phosphodiesterase CpdA